MSYYAVQYTYVNDADALDLVRPRHREFLASLVGETLVASGPYVGAADPSALLLFQGDDAEVIEERLNHDPFWQEGLIARRHIQEWNPVIGIFANA